MLGCVTPYHSEVNTVDHLFRSDITLNNYLTVFCIISLDFYIKAVLIKD